MLVEVGMALEFFTFSLRSLFGARGTPSPESISGFGSHANPKQGDQHGYVEGSSLKNTPLLILLEGLLGKHFF